MKIRDAIYLLLNRFTNLVQVKRLTQSYTVEANTVASIDFTQSIDGYKMVGVVGFSSNHSNALIQQAKILPGNNSVRITVRNIISSSITATAEVELLYIKSLSFGGGYKPTRFNAFGTLKGVAICG